MCGYYLLNSEEHWQKCGFWGPSDLHHNTFFSPLSHIVHPCSTSINYQSLFQHLSPPSWKTHSNRIGLFSRAWARTTLHVPISAMLVFFTSMAMLGGRAEGDNLKVAHLKTQSNTGFVHSAVDWAFWYFHIYMSPRPASQSKKILYTILDMETIIHIVAN